MTFPDSKYNIKHNIAYHNALLQPSTSFLNLLTQVRFFRAIQWHSTDKSKYLTDHRITEWFGLEGTL